MESLQIRLTPQFLSRLDYLVEKGIYSNRNEAIRDAVRKMIVEYDILMKTARVRSKLKSKISKSKASSVELIQSVRAEGDNRI